MVLDGVIVDKPTVSMAGESEIVVSEVLTQIEDMKYKVSMRSGGVVNVSVIAQAFGGGGHMRAAGCTMQGTFHDCVNNLSLHIEKQLKENADV